MPLDATGHQGAWRVPVSGRAPACELLLCKQVVEVDKSGSAGNFQQFSAFGYGHPQRPLHHTAAARVTNLSALMPGELKTLEDPLRESPESEYQTDPSNPHQKPFQGHPYIMNIPETKGSVTEFIKHRPSLKVAHLEYLYLLRLELSTKAPDCRSMKGTMKVLTAIHVGGIMQASTQGVLYSTTNYPALNTNQQQEHGKSYLVLLAEQSILNYCTN